MERISLRVESSGGGSKPIITHTFTIVGPPSEKNQGATQTSYQNNDNNDNSNLQDGIRSSVGVTKKPREAPRDAEIDDNVVNSKRTRPKIHYSLMNNMIY